MSEMKSFKQLAEDVYAADRKEKQWVDPQTGKTKKRTIQTHRIQFAASKLHKAAGEKDSIPDYLLPQDERKQQKEEHMEELKSELFEVLSKDATAADWIHDFVHSDNPKFTGKSKKERIQMALGAYYAKARAKDGEGLSEDAEHITERNKKNALMRKVMDAARGARWKSQNNVSSDDVRDWDGKHKTAQAQNKAIGRALRNEEAEELEEAKDTVVKDANGKLVSFKHEGDWKKVNPKKNPEGKVHNLAGQALKKAQELSKEEVELEEDKYAGLEAEDKKGLPTAMIKKSKKAVEGDTVEGWDHPHNAVKKESYEEGNSSMSKTYNQFMEDLIEGQIIKTATGYRHIGTYGTAKGAKYGNTDYEKDTLETKDDESGEPQAKRGRGRPAGAKSGARKITGTSKLYK